VWPAVHEAHSGCNLSTPGSDPAGPGHGQRGKALPAPVGLPRSRSATNSAARASCALRTPKTRRNSADDVSCRGRRLGSLPINAISRPAGLHAASSPRLSATRSSPAEMTFLRSGSRQLLTPAPSPIHTDPATTIPPAAAQHYNARFPGGRCGARRCGGSLPRAKSRP
jgi:hypothetical protein